MATVNYSKSSPYADTKKFGNFLDILSYRNIPAKPDDVMYTIGRVYKYRPDLLAYDLYGDAALWWVFAVRNPNTLKNPLGDFLPGVSIAIPKKSTINNALGL